MMWLINFFKDLADVIYRLIEFLIWFIQSIFEAVGMCAKAVGTATYYAAQLPAVWVSAFIAIITIAIIFKVKG